MVPRGGTVVSRIRPAPSTGVNAFENAASINSRCITPRVWTVTRPFSTDRSGNAACPVEEVDGRALPSWLTSSARFSEGVTDRAATLDPPRAGEIDMVGSFHGREVPFTHRLTELDGGCRGFAGAVYQLREFPHIRFLMFTGGRLVIHRCSAKNGLQLCMTPEQEVAAFRDWPEPAVCGVLAARVRRARLDVGESQAEFAARAGIPLRTYKRFEAKGSATLENFIRILRTLGRAQYLVLVFPAALPLARPTLDDRVRGIRFRAARERT